MTWKKFWKRVNALLHDNRTVLRDGEDIEDWEEVQCKQREEEVERQKKEQEILATWFLREEYIKAGWFKRFLLRLEFLFRDTRGESHIPQIPEHIRKEIARCLLPDIVAYYESEEEKREREARHAGEAVGVLVGGAVGVAIELSKPKPTPAEDVDIDEDENKGFEITM